jgi:hypothetical protein
MITLNRIYPPAMGNVSSGARYTFSITEILGEHDRLHNAHSGDGCCQLINCLWVYDFARILSEPNFNECAYSQLIPTPDLPPLGGGGERLPDYG